jgi:hypothetical protein
MKLSVAIELKDILVTNVSCHHLKLTDWHERRLNHKLEVDQILKVQLDQGETK